MAEINSGNTVTNTGTNQPFVDPPENISKQRIVVPKTIKIPKPIIEKPTFRAVKLYDAMVAVAEEVRNKKDLFGDLISEGSLNIFFSRAGTGKSFLSKQASEAFATGKNVLDVMHSGIIESYSTTKGFNLKNQTIAQEVIYVDFEATEKNDYTRYTNKSERENLDIIEVLPYHFSDNITVLYPDKIAIQNPLMFIDEIEEEVKKRPNAKILFIDNMAAISWENEKGSNAARLMNKIRDLQRRYNLTVIVMAHTTKIVKGEPILDTSLAGSFNVFNLAENVWAIGESVMDDTIRYIIQLKARYGDVHFNKNNVITLQFKEYANGFKGFEFLSYESEEALLAPISKEEKNEINQEIINAVRYGLDNEGKRVTGTSIAKEMYENHKDNIGVSKSTYIERIKKQYSRMKNKGVFNFDDNNSPEITDHTNEKIPDSESTRIADFKQIMHKVIEENMNSERFKKLNNSDNLST